VPGSERRPLRVAITSHTARISGAEHTLLDFLTALPPGVHVEVGAPAGPLSERVRALDAPWFPLRGTDAGLKLHPIRTPVAAATLVADGLAVARRARRQRLDVIHANSTRAALSAAVARLLGGPPVVVHLHDVLGDDRVSRLVRWVVARSADAVLANSAHVAATLRLPEGRAPVAIFDNPVDLDRFDPDHADGAAVRAELGIAADVPVITLVGQITPWKGQDLAIRALAALPERHQAAVLLLAGAPVFTSAGTRYDNLAYERGLRTLADELEVADRVRFLGARDDVPNVLAAGDVALVPSREEPFGRVVIEALAMQLAVVATSRGGPPEIVEGGAGITLPPEEPAPWAAAIAALLDDPGERRRLAHAGAARVRERYALPVYAARVVEGYWAALG
jgi:glycosyltransferase involved in cell wall biosynthesis